MARPALLSPLRHRDFALLWTGQAISLLGDGVYFVAIAWLVYGLSDSPGSLALVGVAWSVGMVSCLLVGGLASDRLPRRSVLIASDLVRLAAMTALGLLALSGRVELWHVVAIGGVYGAAEAFFGPAFSALVPQLVQGEDRLQAGAFQEVARPIGLRLVGPAVGGVLVGAFGAPTALLVDAGSFVLSIACFSLIRLRQAPAREAVHSLRDDLVAGVRYVRAHAWLWATFASVCGSLLCVLGPVEVLLPYIVRHELHRPASDFGLVLAAGGVGSILGAVAVSRRGLPRRPVRAMFWGFGLAHLPTAGYALATATWQLAVLAAVSGACGSAALVVWIGVKQLRVPEAVFGRVASLDWLVSVALTPLSFALTGPVVAAVGVSATLMGAGLLAAALTAAFWLGVGDLRRDEHAAPPSSGQFAAQTAVN